MALSNQEKIDKRREILNSIKNLSEGERLHVDKDILEELLFQEITFNKQTNKTLKIPVWYGKFLSRIDLSEVSFENVSWNLIVKKKDLKKYTKANYITSEYCPIIDIDTFCTLTKILPVLDDNEIIDYSLTNANIEFEKSFEYKYLGFTNNENVYCGDIMVSYCDFSGTDLSNNAIYSPTGFICNTNLSNTNITIQNQGCPTFIGCNMTGVDLSKYNAEGFSLILDNGEEFSNCVLTNTCINIIFGYNSLYVDEYLTDIGTYSQLLKTIKDNIGHLLESTKGCFINGILNDENNKSRIINEGLNTLKTYKSNTNNRDNYY